jgi:L-threonylcarbamoyladenylate synthase
MILNLEKAAEIIKNGGVVAFPTETVYGLGARADMESAVSRVYDIKKRPRDNPMICHFAHIEDIYQHIEFVPSYFEKLSKKFCPGPLSFRLRAKQNSGLMPSMAGQDSVVCRVPDHDLARKLIELVDQPVVGPSANTSGSVSNTSALMVEDDLGSQIDGVIDGGNCHVGLESTIIDCTSEKVIRILRPGFISVNDIKDALGPDFADIEYIDFEHSKILDVVPGLKYKHYSPKTTFQKVTDTKSINFNESLILVTTIEDLLGIGDKYENNDLTFIVLGSISNLPLLAQNLYANLRFIDMQNPEQNKKATLYLNSKTESKIAESSLGQAILNRLNRSCAA